MSGTSDMRAEAASVGRPGELIVFDLRTLTQYADEGPAIRVLSDIGTARVVLLGFRSGQELPAHQTSDQVLAQALRGEIVLRTAGSLVVARAGTLLQLEANVQYSIVARTNAVVLLTMTPGPGHRGLDRETFGGLSPLVARAPDAGRVG